MRFALTSPFQELACVAVFFCFLNGGITDRLKSALLQGGDPSTGAGEFCAASRASSALRIVSCAALSMV